MMMTVVYGFKSNGNDDKYLAVADEVIRQSSFAQVPGAFMCDLFPARTDPLPQMSISNSPKIRFS